MAPHLTSRTLKLTSSGFLTSICQQLQITLGAWVKFTKELHLTTVGYMYVSEHHLMHTGLKACMRDIIRVNRPCAP